MFFFALWSMYAGVLVSRLGLGLGLGLGLVPAW